MQPDTYLSEDDIKSIQDQLKEENVKASKEDYEIFLETSVWDDMKSVMQARVDGLVKGLEDLGNSRMADVVYKSRLHELRQLISFPENMVAILKLTEESENVNETVE
jgi:hypothetical protein